MTEGGVGAAVVLVQVPVIVQREVKSLQRGAEWNRAQLGGNFRISGVAPDLRSLIRIPAKVMISHVGETVIMRLCVQPLLTRDPIHSGICFSNIVTT